MKYQEKSYEDLSYEIEQNARVIRETPSGAGGVEPNSISLTSGPLSVLIGNTGYICTITRECMNSCTWTNC
jgi:hypothetical protein